MKQFWSNLATPLKLVAILVLVAVLYFGGSSLYYTVRHGAETAIENYQDRKMQDKVDALEVEKQANQRVIEVLQADNIKLKAERAAQDAQIKAIRNAILNDGKIVEAEQRKIDEATRKFNETKNSCATITDVDAYVECVVTKLDTPN